MTCEVAEPQSRISETENKRAPEQDEGKDGPNL